MATSMHHYSLKSLPGPHSQPGPSMPAHPLSQSLSVYTPRPHRPSICPTASVPTVTRQPQPRRMPLHSILALYDRSPTASPPRTLPCTPMASPPRTLPCTPEPRQRHRAHTASVSDGCYTIGFEDWLRKLGEPRLAPPSSCSSGSTSSDGLSNLCPVGPPARSSLADWRPALRGLSDDRRRTSCPPPLPPRRPAPHTYRSAPMTLPSTPTRPTEPCVQRRLRSPTKTNTARFERAIGQLWDRLKKDSRQTVSGVVVRAIWQRSGVSDACLYKIWEEIELRTDGRLGFDQFLIGMMKVSQSRQQKSLNQTSNKPSKSFNHLDQLQTL